jgi:hypothetical protein
LQDAVAFRDVAISIFRELSFYEVYYRKCRFVLFKITFPSQKVFILGQGNFVQLHHKDSSDTQKKLQVAEPSRNYAILIFRGLNFHDKYCKFVLPLFP